MPLAARDHGPDLEYHAPGEARQHAARVRDTPRPRCLSLSLSLHARDGVPRAHQRARKQEQELASDVPCSKLRPALRSSMPAPAQQQTLHTTHRNTAGFPLLIGIHVFFFSRLEKIKYKRKRGRRKKKKKRGRKRKENNKKKE